MAISLIARPQTMTPGYNPAYWYFNSTNKNIVGFRYVVDVYINGSTTRLKRLRIPPAPTTGYGIMDISKTLQSYLTAENPNTQQPIFSSNSQVRYELRVGESYPTTWVYSDYEFYNNPGQPFNAYVLLTSQPVGGGGTNQTHTFVPGDFINVVQADGGALKPQLSGLQEVVAVPNQFSVVINIPFSAIGSGPAVQGSVTYADGRSTTFPNLFNSGGLKNPNWAFNGAVPHTEFPSYLTTTYGMNLTTQVPPLSTVPEVFRIGPQSKMVLNYNTNLANQLLVVFENNLGTVRKGNISTLLGATQIVSVGVGPQNIPNGLVLFAGNGQIIQPGVEWYEVYFERLGTRLTQKRRFVLDPSCMKFPTYDLVFLDRLGSLGTFQFIYANRQNQSIERESNRTQVGGLLTGPNRWGYSNLEGSNQVRDVNVQEEYALTTAWLNDEESVYFKELLSSAYVYMLINGEYQPVLVTNTGEEIKKTVNNKNIRYTVNVRIANPNIINW
jgi:hypothetical protein